MKKRTTITTEMERKMRELRAQGKSAKEIAAVIGVSATAVKNHTAGIIPESRELDAKRKKLKEKVRRLYLEGRTYTQIETEVGVSSDTIRNYTKDLIRRGRNQIGNCISPEKIAQARELRTQGKSIEEIAGILGIHRETVRKYTRDIPSWSGNKSGASVSPEKPEQPKTGQPGSLCRHKKTCRYWRPLSGLGGGVIACHYPIDRNELRPWPADQCPGFPGPKAGPNKDPMGLKQKE